MQSGIRFFGIPVGCEFSSLFGAIVDISKGSINLSQSTKDKLKVIDKPLHIQVLITPTCPYCYRMVRLTRQLAVENLNIRADMVEIDEFPQLVNKYGVMGVPKTIIDEPLQFLGLISEDVVTMQVILAHEAKAIISSKQ